MPWREVSVMEQREEFVRLALQPGANRHELCRRFGVHRSNGYKWLERYAASGRAGLEDCSRRPKSSPARTGHEIEAAVLRIRAASNGAWGGRKIAAALRREGCGAVPAPSTITEILRRHGELVGREREHPGPYRRFERAAPNELWQMDFKGHIAIATGRCHPLGVLDDHSRYSLGLAACGDERDATVRERLRAIFRRFGLPDWMLMDNGPPWGDSGAQPHTQLTVWLLRLGIGVSHGRPRHPQTQGKQERFHRTLKAELLDGFQFRDLAACQAAFDRWRHRYNHERPHQALEMATPGERYRPSRRSFPETLAPIEYGPGDQVRRVDGDGKISFANRPRHVGKAFRGQPVALRPTSQDGVFTVHFCSHAIGTLDVRQPAEPACGFVDIAGAMPTTPQAPQQQA
jgi:transposase InsO family protein